MVRAVKTKAVRSLKKGERALLMPGATGAEPWEVWVLGVQVPAECVQTCSTPLENKLLKNSALALPAAQVFCLPLWLNETDPKLLGGMIPLQLELRGLQPRGGGPAVFDWSVVAEDETRTLVMIGVLPAMMPEELHVEAYHTFDLSVRYLALPENALTLWKEQDRLVIAITRGTKLIYFQALSEGTITTRVAQDLTCIWTTLSMEGMLVSLNEVMLWTEVSTEEFNLLRTSLQLPIKQRQRPLPEEPSPAWKLIPASVGEAKRTREMRRWRNRGIWIAVAVYLLIVAGLLLRCYMTSRKVDELQKWQAAHVGAVTAIHTTAATWKALQPVVDEKNYPLELLLHACKSMPADQMHLTLFEASEGHLLIKGEAKNVAAAFQFLDHLKTDPGFTGYTWNMGQPQILPNDLAQMQIEGTREN